MYMICIQVTGVLYLGFYLAPLLIQNHMREQVSSDGLALVHLYIEDQYRFTLVEIGHILSSFFYYLHYAFMLLQCANYRQLLCHPLHFADFIKTKKILLRISLTLVLAALATADEITLAILNSTKRSLLSSKRSNISSFNVFIIKKVVIYAMCKTSAFRVVHLCVMLKMAHDMRQSLKEGQRRLDGTDRRPVFIAVAVVPIIISILSHTVETCMMLIDYFFLPSGDSVECSDVQEAIQRHIQVPIVTATHLIASFANCCTYLICFPKLRENPCFK